jgi:hypothetical protein
MKTMKLFSMAALALAMAACSSEDNEILQNTQQPGTMHFTATIAAPSGDATTRTVYTEDGTTINVKWAVGDQIALVHNGVVDVAEVKTVDDVTGKATIEADFTGSPSDNDDVYLAYPADAVVSATPYETFPFTPNPITFDKVKNNQDGTLEYIQNNLDLRMGSGKLAVSGSDVTLKESVSIPSLICIWKLTLQDNAATPNALNATQLKFKNNTATQAKATSTAKSVYYLCVVPSFIPDASGTFSFEATVGEDTYTFWRTGLSLTAGKYYQSTVKMAKPTDLSTISSDYQVKNGEVLTGTLGSNVKISIADGATVMLKDVTITNLGNNCDWAGINCPGDATLVLEGTNDVCAGRNGGGYNNYPGIYIASGKTLTIQGDGTLTAYSNGTNPMGAGIGGGNAIACGNIVINSGNITATGGGGAASIGGGDEGGTCGTITINGGTVEATGGDCAAGIGGGKSAGCGNITISGGTVTAKGGFFAAGIGGGMSNGTCGTITIKSTVTKVTATKGSYAPYSIGSGGNGGAAISVTIEAGADVTQN